MQRTLDHDIDAVLRSPEGALRRHSVFRILNEEAVPLSPRPGVKQNRVREQPTVSKEPDRFVQSENNAVTPLRDGSLGR